MKNILNIFLIFWLILALSSCITSKDDINKAKENIWIIETIDNNVWKIEGIQEKNDINNENNQKEEIKEEIIVKKKKKEEEKKIEIIYWVTEQLLEFKDLSWENVLDWEVEISWKTLWKIDKITVTFSNDTSDFPIDKYTLKQFKSWDKEFLYRAFSRYETLDFWKNIYVFEAYYWDKISKSQVIINVVKKEEVSLKEKVSKTYEDFSLSNLPVSATFWNPVDLGGW